MSEAHLIDLWVIKPLAACKVQVNAHVIKASWQLVEELALLRNKRIRPPYKANCFSMAVLRGHTHTAENNRGAWNPHPWLINIAARARLLPFAIATDVFQMAKAITVTLRGVERRRISSMK